MSEEPKKSNTNDVSPSPPPVLSCLRSRTDGTRKNNNAKVSFPEDASQLITGYLEPPNPWEYAENVSRDDLIGAYRASCEKHGIDPLPAVLEQLQTLDIEDVRSECLSLKGESLVSMHCESLEEVLKRVQFKNIDLESTALDDEGSVALFDMVEYYESATHLNISGNKGIGIRGWQACSRMIKKTHCLEELNARNVPLNEPFMPILSRALKISTQLQVLKLENASLTGRSMVILVGALKLNTGLKELYLADNGLNVSDAAQLGALLRSNSTLQLLDISNNCIQDAGANHILDGLVQQAEQASGGLSILIVWNNRLSRNASNGLARALARSRTLEMLNIGRNVLTNECLHAIKSSLQQNRTLLRIGMQSTHISCEGAVALAECIANNPVIQRIDLRDNSVLVAGLMALALSMKVNRSVSQLDLDDAPKRKLESAEALKQYQKLVQEIREYCCRNEQAAVSEEKDVVEESETTPERRVRLPSAASRKISLTCETLMRAMATPQDADPQPHLLSEPRRSGGRLRSPAPSPVPSPASSPVPSPSRNRFQVSRVSETSPASSPSPSPSSSSSSLSPSPNRFFSSPGMSRFRVTLVEPSANPSAPKPIISSPSGNNVTVGFSFKLNDKEITINTSVAGSCGIVTTSNSVISGSEVKVANNTCIKSAATDMPQDTADLEVMQLMNRQVCEGNWEPCLHTSEMVDKGQSDSSASNISSPKAVHPTTESVNVASELKIVPSPVLNSSMFTITSAPVLNTTLLSDSLPANMILADKSNPSVLNTLPPTDIPVIKPMSTTLPDYSVLNCTPSSLLAQTVSNTSLLSGSNFFNMTPMSPSSDTTQLSSSPVSNIVLSPQSFRPASNAVLSPHSDQFVVNTSLVSNTTSLSESSVLHTVPSPLLDTTPSSLSGKPITNTSMSIVSNTISPSHSSVLHVVHSSLTDCSVSNTSLSPVSNTTSLSDSSVSPLSDRFVLNTISSPFSDRPVFHTSPFSDRSILNTISSPLSDKPSANTTTSHMPITTPSSPFDRSVSNSKLSALLERPTSKKTPSPLSERPTFNRTPSPVWDWPVPSPTPETNRLPSPHTDVPTVSTMTTSDNVSASVAAASRSLTQEVEKISPSVISAQPVMSSPREEEEKWRMQARGRTRKISWVAPVEQRVPSSLEKLLGLFQHPSSFFSKTQPQYKATAAIVNQQPIANSSASFLLTAGPLAGYRPEEGPIPSSPDDEPETDVLNNNGRTAEQPARTLAESCSRCSAEEKEQARTRDDARLWCGSVCGTVAREPSPCDDLKECARSFAPTNGMLPGNSARLVGGSSGESTMSRLTRDLTEAGIHAQAAEEE